MYIYIYICLYINICNYQCNHQYVHICRDTQAHTHTLTRHMKVPKFLRLLPSLVSGMCSFRYRWHSSPVLHQVSCSERFAEIVTWCVYHCSTGDCKSTFFYAQNSPAWNIHYTGRKPNLEKTSRKNMFIDVQKYVFRWEFTVFHAPKIIFRGW